ncbi:MAG: ACT domain-containing protein [Actinomycetota bacterium]|nr:ACT domain-containing protein [Actinomycetota bacterium]
MLEEIIIKIGEDRPGILAEIGEILGRADVNIETLSASDYNGQGVMHLVVDDGEEAAEVLKSSGYAIEAARPVLTTTLDDRPGELGRYCRKLTDSGVMISAAYVARRSGGETQLIIAVDDLGTAEQASL